MTPSVIRYPLDPTGTNRNNLVQGEVHQMVRRKVRVIAATYGAFYADSVQIVDTATGKALVRGTQFVASEMYNEPTARFGKEVCAILLITDTNVSDEVSIQYQAVGGPYSNSVKAIEQLIAALNIDDRPVSKDSIIDWPSEFPPSHHLHDVGDTYGWEYVVTALNRVLSAVQSGSTLKYDAIYAYIDMVTGHVSPEIVQKILDTVNAAMAAHLADPDPHHQYLTRAEALSLQPPNVKKPVNQTPAPGTPATGSQVTLILSQFYSLYGLTQQAAQFRLSRASDLSGALDVDVTVGAVSQYAVPSNLLANTTYYWSGRYQDTDGTWSAWSDITSFGTGNMLVNQPSIAAPLNGSDVITNGLTLTGSAFSTTGFADTHASTDWEIWTGPNGTGSRVFNSPGNSANKTSIAVAPGVLNNNVTYYPRVRYNGATLGASPWSAARSFNLKYPPFPTTFGEAFGGGYYAGDFVLNGATYVVLVAPKASGETTSVLSSSTNQYFGNDNDSVYDTNSLKAFGSAAANWVKALTIGGFTDWAIPAVNVMKMISTNLNPASANTPALFKTGGTEAMTIGGYWSSSPYDHVVDKSYTDPPTPIYQTQQKSYSDPRSFSYGPVGESVDYSSYIKCAQAESGPFNKSGPTFTPSGNTLNGERIGYYSASWTCTVYYDDQVLVGYTPGAYHQVLVNTYDALYISTVDSSVQVAAKATSLKVRAIRLVQKS
jgi:hypothetical protein